jgi:hypothetical protein
MLHVGRSTALFSARKGFALDDRPRYRLEALLANSLAEGALNKLAGHFVQNLLAVTCLDNFHRRLARAKTRHLDLPRQSLQAPGKRLLDAIRWYRHGQTATERTFALNRYLHL